MLLVLCSSDTQYVVAATSKKKTYKNPQGWTLIAQVSRKLTNLLHMQIETHAFCCVQEEAEVGEDAVTRNPACEPRGGQLWF